MAQTTAMTVTVDSKTLAEAKRIAGPRGLSALVNAALQAEVRRRRVIDLLVQWDQDDPATPGQVGQVRTELRALLGWTDEEARRYVADARQPKHRRSRKAD